MSTKQPIDTEAATSETSRSIGGTKGRANGGETEVDPFMNVRLKPYPDTQNVVMPLVSYGAITIATGNGASAQWKLSIRLNSIVDSLTSLTFANDPTPAAMTADGTDQKPMFYKYWSKIYNYWTVVKTTYALRLIMDTRDVPAEYSLWTYHHGQQSPPFQNESGSSNVADWARETHPNCHKTTIRDSPAERTVSTTASQSYAIGYQNGSYYGSSNSAHVHGKYEPGTYYVHNPVAEDALNETWHKVDAVPSLHEYATFILNRSDLQRFIGMSAACNFKYELKVIYHVQFKDLKRIYEYPTEQTDDPEKLDYALMTPNPI